MRKKIFFVTYGGGHANAIVPLVNLVKQKNKYDYEILALTMARKIFERENIAYLNLSDFADDEVFTLGRKVINNLNDVNSDIPIEESIAYYGFGIRDLIEVYGENEAYKKFNNEGRKSFLPIKTMEQIIRKIEPDLLVTTSSPRMEQAAIIAAKSLGVKVLRIEQLFYAENLEIPKEVYFAVINNIVKDKLVSKGIEETFIHVTGQPAFDKLHKKEGIYNNSTLLKDKLNLNDNDKILLWISPGNKDQTDILEKIIEIEKKYSNIKVIIKLHPNEDGEIPKRLIKKRNSNIIILNSDLHSLIHLSNIVIIEFSSVGLEAILLDKDLIVINDKNIKGKIPYAQSGAAVEVFALSELEGMINKVLYNKNVRLNMRSGREKYGIDGKATLRVYQLINRIIEEDMFHIKD